MKTAYIFILAALLTVVSSAVSAQERQIDFINDLDAKQAATYSDGVAFMAIIVNGRSAGFNVDRSLLTAKGFVTGSYDAKDPLKRGALAKMLALYLKLDDSLLFNLTHSERYAYRACVAQKIMPAKRSEYDTLSGTELIEIMSRIKK